MGRYKIRPLGHKQLMWLLWNGQLMFEGLENTKTAHCKVCGKQLNPNEGLMWYKFAPNNDFLFQKNYFCNVCSNFTESVHFTTKGERYLRCHSPEQRRLMWEYISQHWNEF